MLDLKFIEENEKRVREMLEARGVEFDLDKVLDLAARRRETIASVEAKRAEQNKTSKKIGELAEKIAHPARFEISEKELKTLKKEKEEALERAEEVKKSLGELEPELSAIEAELHNLLLYLPNVHDPSVPVGPDETYNEIRRVGREPREFDFPPRPHWELGEMLGVVDQERAVKIAGARFAMTVGAGARMERALQNLMLDEAAKRGYEEVIVPFMVLGSTMEGTGQLPKFAAEMYKLDGEDMWLIPTAEVPVTNLHRDEILTADELPIKYAAFTPCFRREAGAPGRDTRGMIRVHQFLKVELVKIVHPDNSYDELESLVADAAHVLDMLELPYREAVLSTGDLGFGATKCVDLEVWIPTEEKYREISSCSNYEAFQARRMNTRFRPKKGAKPEFVHTLNGSGLAIGRTVVAILENFQNADGSVTIPDALRPYMDGLEKIT
ncbi:MAG: serine--tRNA ligase [candidate division Zixibacteria bacterium]|nr:serine--tRNA ligase [candidate division Zixibacteria bacterium]